MKCYKCGKETDELISTFDSMADESDNPYDISDCMDGDYLDETKFTQKYGTEDLKQFWFIDQLVNTVCRVLLCKECFYEEDEE